MVCTRGTVLGTDLRQQVARRNAIINIGARNHDGQQQTQGIDQQMPLTSLDFLAPVLAPGFASDLRGLHRLTIDARRAGGGLPSRFPAHPLP